MLIKDNKQHVRALTAIANACSTIRRFEVNADYFFMCTLLNNGMRSDNMTRLLRVTWEEHKASIYVPLRGKYYAKIKPTLNGKYAAYEIILTSNDKSKNTCAYVEHYNSTGGYWYTPSHELGNAGQSALNSSLFTSLQAIIRAFNRACYLR